MVSSLTVPFRAACALPCTSLSYPIFLVDLVLTSLPLEFPSVPCLFSLPFGGRFLSQRFFHDILRVWRNWLLLSRRYPFTFWRCSGVYAPEPPVYADPWFLGHSASRSLHLTPILLLFPLISILLHRLLLFLICVAHYFPWGFGRSKLPDLCLFWLVICNSASDSITWFWHQSFGLFY